MLQGGLGRRLQPNPPSAAPSGGGIRTTMLRRDYQKLKRVQNKQQQEDKLKLDQ